MSLNKFLEYLPARKQAKVERKQKRKEKKGKEMNINYLIASHDIIKKGDKYIMLGEAYYPTYRTETRTDANGNVTYRTVFDGYQYTHAVVAGFDKDGHFPGICSSFGFGHMEIGTVTPKPQPGNPKPRLFRFRTILFAL